MMVISLFEGIAAIIIIPIVNFSGIINVNITSIPFLKDLKFLLEFPKEIGLPVFLGIYVSLIITQQLLQNKLNAQRAFIQVCFINALRLKVYQYILQAKWEFFINRRRSDLISSLTNELGRVNSGTSQILNFFTSIIYTIIQIAIAFILSPQITAFVLICGLLMSLLARKFISKSRSIGQNTTEIGKKYYAGINDHLQGMKEIKSNNLEPSMQNWLESLNGQITHEKMENTKLRNNSQLVYKAISAILLAIFIYVSFNLFHSKPEQLLMIVLIFTNLWPKFMDIQRNTEKIASSVPACESLFCLEKEIVIMSETPEILKPTTHIKKKYKMIECKGVYYRYNKDLPIYALENITLKVPSNCTTAIIGHSGAGKSTLIDILMGLLKAEKGQVFIDGTPLTEENVLEFRKEISYVPQEPFLFHDSIRENFKLVKPNACDEEIWEALSFAAADEFVKKLPNGIDTVIGDRGIRLSGGERQRLVLARAIIRKPSILVLDEATSSLDIENEAKIQEALDHLKGKMTIIVVAHRLSTIRNADQVIVLENGEIIQKGNLIDLMKGKKGLFNYLSKDQLEVSV